MIRKRNKIFKFIIALFIFTIGIISFGYKEADAIINPKNVTKQTGQKTYPLGSDVVFRGVFSSHSWFFNTDRENFWRVNSAELEFNYSINQILDKNAKAYLTFSVNGIPFKSQEVKYKKDTTTQTIKLTIPKKLITVGSNEIKVESYSRISDLPCVDDVNNANWLTINKNTKVVVNFNKLRADNMISNFPYPFIEVSDEKKSNNQIVIPDKNDNSEISDSLMLNTHLGGLIKDQKYNGTISKYSDMSKNKNTIFVGLYENLPKELKKEVNGGKAISDNEGILKLIDSPYTKTDNTKVLIITAKNDKYLEKAVRTLMNESIVKQLNISEYKVTENVDELDKLDKDIDKVKFSKLAGDNILLKGPFRRSVNLGYSIPKNKILAVGGQVSLNFRYAENLDFDRSLVTVYINKVPIGSKKLTQDKANGDSVVFNIPNDIKDTSYLDIEVAFDLEMKNTWCEKRQEETPWAYVTGDSYIYIPTADNTNYYFKQYPSPFIKDNNLNDLLLVVPKDINSSDLTALGDMFSYIGNDVHYNRGSLTVASGDNVGDLKNDKNIIVYGTPKNNEFIKEINNNLWFKYKDNFTAFDSNAKEFLTDPYSKEISTFQLDVSPFNSQRGMLVMTAPNENILKDSLEYISTDKVYKLNGDSAIIDSYGNVKNFKMKEEKDTKPVFDKFKEASTLTKGLIGVFGLFFILIIVSALLYINKYKKDSEDDTTKSHKKTIKKLFKK